jgi:hypothetical protein
MLGVLAGVVGTVTVTFLTASFIVPMFSGDDRPLRLEVNWVSSWGESLHAVSSDALLGYLAATLVLYGISYGGQATFEDPEQRRTVRRIVGLIGVVIAVGSLALVVFATGAAIAKPAYTAVLIIVVIPMASLSTVLGAAVGRFTVPNHAEQVAEANAEIIALGTVRAALPGRSRSSGQAVTTLVGYGAAHAAVALLLVGQLTWPAVLAAVVSGAAFAAAVTQWVLTDAVRGTERNRVARFGFRLFAVSLYLLLTLAALTIAIRAASPQAVLLLSLLCIGELFLAFLLYRPLPANAAGWVRWVRLGAVTGLLQNRFVTVAFTRWSRRRELLLSPRGTTHDSSDEDRILLDELRHGIGRER